MTLPDRFLFVSGCPRSGTTVMTTLLNWHDSVLVTQERYAPLLKFDAAAFGPGLFEPARMSEFRRGECGYTSFAAQREYSAHYANPKDFSAIGSYPIRGDKITHLYRNVERFEEPAWSGCDIMLVHMIRKLDDVVSSYETRRLDAADAWREGIDAAIRDWTASVEDIFRYTTATGKRAKVGIVEYERLFSGEARDLADGLARVYAFAGLELGEKQMEGVAKVHKASKFFEKRRALHAEAVAEARRRISTETLHRFEQLREQGL